MSDKNDLHTAKSTLENASYDVTRLFNQMTTTTQDTILEFINQRDLDVSSEEQNKLWDRFVEQYQEAANEILAVLNDKANQMTYRKLSRGGFLKTLSAYVGAGVFVGGALGSGWLKDNSSKEQAPEQDNESIEIEEAAAGADAKGSHGESKNQKLLSAIHHFGFGYFSQLILEMSTNPNRKFTTKDYATLLATNILAIQLSSEEEARHMVHELQLGYGSLGIVIPFAATMEGVSGDLGAILRDRLKSEDISKQDFIAAASVLSNGMSRYFGLTISAAKCFGDEIIDLANDMVKHHDGDQKAAQAFLARSIAHTGNNASLGFNFVPGDPPVILQLMKYGLPSTWGLSGAYYSLPGLYSTVKTAQVGNKAFGIPDPTGEAIKSVAKIYRKVFAPFILATWGNLKGNKYTHGAKSEIKARLAEARHNMGQILKANPDSATQFIHAAHPHSRIVKGLHNELTNFEQTEYDPIASDIESLMEEALGKNVDQKEGVSQFNEILSQALLTKNQDEANGLFAMAEKKLETLVTNNPQEEKYRLLRGSLRTLWVLNDEIRRGSDLSDLDSVPAKISKIADRILNHERMADTLGHANNDLIAVATGQMLVVNHAVYVVGNWLKSIMDTELPDMAKLGAFMEFIRHPSGFADNLAAGNMGDQIASKLGLPFIAANYSASIQGGGDALTGNPAANYSMVPQGKDITFGMPESMKHYLHPTDIAVINLLNTHVLNSYNVEERIFNALGQEHPNLKNASDETKAKWYINKKDQDMSALKQGGMSRDQFFKRFAIGQAG